MLHFALAIGLALTACGQTTDVIAVFQQPQARPPDTAPAPGGAPARTDGGQLADASAAPKEAGLPREAGSGVQQEGGVQEPQDAAHAPDATPTADAALSPDAGEEPRATRCSGTISRDGSVVALYTFDDDEGLPTVADRIGSHHGRLGGGLVSTVPGPEGCGRGLALGPDSNGYFIVDDSPDWDLTIGSIDLWLKLPVTLADRVAVFSRDVDERDTSGHISLYVERDGRPVVRIQPSASDESVPNVVACGAEPLPSDQWVHLGVNFGVPTIELYVDGKLAQGELSSPDAGSKACAQPGSRGIDGNDLPWVFGRNTARSSINLEQLDFPAVGCAIDHVRISRERRAFWRAVD